MCNSGANNDFQTDYMYTSFCHPSLSSILGLLETFYKMFGTISPNSHTTSESEDTSSPNFRPCLCQ